MDDALRPQRGTVSQFLTFRLDDRFYGVSAADVLEVIRVPGVARIPQSPRGLMGLANLRGAVIPVASGRDLLGQSAAAMGEGARAIVLNGDAPVAVAVDAIGDLVEVPQQEMQSAATEAGQLPGEIISGSFRAPSDGRLVKLLDIKSLLAATIVVEERSRPARPTSSTLQAESGGDARSAEMPRLISFAVGGQEYALPLDGVQEVIAAPATIASQPEDEALVLGVASLRDQVLPLLSLRGLLGFSPNMEPGRERVVVTRAHGHLFGLVVDEMRSIFPADETRIDPVPDVLAARTGGESRIAAIYRGQGDNRLVSILSPGQIFGDTVMQRLSAAHAGSKSAGEVTAPVIASRQFVVFGLGGEEFALPIETVEEFLTMPANLARVPNTPKFLEGVINLRGQVLPVLDQRKRFEMPPATSQAGRRVMVVRTHSHLAGIIVDTVSEVLRVSLDSIGDTPRLAGQKAKLVSGAINLPAQRRIILLLDPVELLSQAERGLLDKFSKQKSSSDRPEA